MSRRGAQLELLDARPFRTHVERIQFIRDKIDEVRSKRKLRKIGKPKEGKPWLKLLRSMRQSLHAFPKQGDLDLRRSSAE